MAVAESSRVIGYGSAVMLVRSLLGLLARLGGACVFCLMKRCIGLLLPGVLAGISSVYWLRC